MIILAVDDKKIPLEALMDAIRQAEPGAELYGFRSSAEALDYARENPCDVIFTDIQMPGMNGMELARQIKLAKPLINIIFATGYSEFATDAIDLRCSGYLVKPVTPEKVRRELDNLRHPVTPPSSVRVRIQTFGNFEVFIDEKPVNFRHEKTKEYLAYLVDRGTMCSNSEVEVSLWEENVSDSYVRILRKELSDLFKAAGCPDVLIVQRNMQGIRTDLVSCDYYDWKRGLPTAINAYRGEYMSQYSWAEITHAALENV